MRSTKSEESLTSLHNVEGIYILKSCILHIAFGSQGFISVTAEDCALMHVFFPSQGNLRVTAHADRVPLVRPFPPSIEMTYATPEVKTTTEPTHLMRVTVAVILSAPQHVFHLHTRRMISIFVHLLPASLVWTLTQCLFSAAHPQLHQGCNATKTEINGGRVQGALVNQSPSRLLTTTLAALSLQTLARFSLKVGRRLPPSRSLLNSGRNPLRRKQMFRMHLPLLHLFPPLLPLWRNVKFHWQLERDTERPTNTAAHSALQARHQP